MPEIRSIDDIIEAVEGADPATRQRLVTALLPLDISIEEDDESLTFEQRTNRSFRILSRLVATQAGNIEALNTTIEAQGRQLREEISGQGKEFRQELSAQGKEFRQDLSAQRKEFREDLSAQGKELREEIATQGKELREEFSAQGKELRKEIAAQSKNIDALAKSIVVQSKNINSLSDRFTTELRAQSSYRGNYAQNAAEADDAQVAALFATRHGLDPNWIKTRRLSRMELDEWKSRHVEVLRPLSLRRDNALVSFTSPDLIAEVRYIRAPSDSPPAYYIAVEASYTVEQKDYDRAIDNARIIGEASGAVVYSVVAGVLISDELDEGVRDKIHEDVDQFLESSEPGAAYWHRLDSADLKPPELSD